MSPVRVKTCLLRGATLAAGETMRPVALREGAEIGRYRLIRPLGAGAMGFVYEAEDMLLRRHVALKVLRVTQRESPQADAALRRFLREGQAAAQVRHPHVVVVFDVGNFEGLPYLVMELIEGESLQVRLARTPRISLDAASDLLLPICSAVAELHAAGVIHRDIKPSNILLDRRDGLPRLADFGVSHLDDGSQLTHSSVVPGTPGYIAPELAQGHARATDRSDQFALAVVLYECVAGRRPFMGASTYEVTHALLTTVPERPSRIEPTLPQAFDRVVLRALSREPAARYPSVDDLAQALLAFASPLAVARWSGELAPTLGATRGSSSPAAWSRTVASDKSHQAIRTVSLLGAVVGSVAVAAWASPRHSQEDVTAAPEAVTVGAPAVQHESSTAPLPASTLASAPVPSLPPAGKPSTVAKARPIAHSPPSVAAPPLPTPSGRAPSPPEFGQNHALILDVP